jgi:GT2 family glycosyltransferase
MMKKGSILPATVYYGGVPMTFVQALIASYRALHNLLPLQAESSAMINLARTKNGKAFLKSNAEWILLLDTDMWWEPNAIIRMVKTAKERKVKVVAGLAFMEQKNRIIPNAYKFIPDGEGGKVLAPFAVLPSLIEPFEVDATGGSCLLVHRDVYQDVMEASVARENTAYWWQEDVYMPIKKEMQGEDITFCKRITEAGYTILYEPRSLFSHLSKDTLLDVREYVEFLERSNIEYGHLRHDTN